MKRMMTRARGSGSTIRKRSSHIRIILTDEIEIKKREKKSGQKKRGGIKKRSPRTKDTKDTTDAVSSEVAQSEISNPKSEI
jgi:large subunit ribosomal protein L22